MIKKYSLFVIFLIVLGAGISSGLDVKYSSFENTIINKILSVEKGTNKDEIKVTIKNFNEIKSKLLDKSYKKIDIDVNNKLNLIGNFPVTVKALNQNGKIDYFNLLINVKIEKNIIKAKNLIRRGTLITENDILEEKSSLTNLPQNVVVNKKTVIGKEAKFDIVSGRFILKYMIREIPLVKNKGEVTIVARNDEFEVEVQGIALQDGQMGEKIKVKNVSSNSNIFAKVVAKNKVEISIE